MTADAGECNGRIEGSEVEIEVKRGGDLKDNGIACGGDGEEIGGCFVIVNGDSDDHSERDLDLKLDSMSDSEDGELNKVVRVGNGGGVDGDLGGERSKGDRVGGEGLARVEVEKGKDVNGSGSDIKVDESEEPEKEAKLDSVGYRGKEVVEIDNAEAEEIKKEEDLVLEEEEKQVGESEIENKDLGSSDVVDGMKEKESLVVEEKKEVVVLPRVEGEAGVVPPRVEEGEAEVVLPHVEDREAEAVLPHIEQREAEVVLPLVEEAQAEAVLPHVEEAEAKAVLPQVEEAEAEAVLPQVEEAEAEVVIPESDSKVELGSVIEKVDLETVVADAHHLNESESVSQVEEERDPVSEMAVTAGKEDVGLAEVKETQNLVDVVEETHNLESLESIAEPELILEPYTMVEGVPAIEAELQPRRNTGVDVSENLSEVESEFEPEQGSDTLGEAKVKDMEPIVLAGENDNRAELQAEVESRFEPKEKPATLGEAEVKEDMEPKVLAEDSDNRAELQSDIEVEQEPELEALVEAADKMESEERKDLPLKNEEANVDAPTDKSSGQLENGSTDSVAEKSSEAMAFGDVNRSMDPTDEVGGVSVKDDLSDESFALESSKSPQMCDAADEELVDVNNGGIVYAEPKADISNLKMEHSTSISVSGVDLAPQAAEVCPSKGTDIETKNSVGDIELECDVPNADMKLKPESGNESAEGSECMVPSVEGARSTNNDDDEEPVHKQPQAAEVTQAAPETYVVKRHQVYMIKIPRFTDDELRKEIHHALSIREEKTRIRDAIGEEIREQGVIVTKYSLDHKAELAKERAVRAVLNSKRQEVDTVMESINRINNANSIAEIDDKIRALSHRQQHETMTLKQEKQHINDINQMKRVREQLSSKKPPQEQIDEALSQRDEIEQRLRNLKKELDSLRADLSSAEIRRKSAWDKFQLEDKHLYSLKEKHNAADGVRQEAYLHWRNLKDQAKHFRMYKADRLAATNYIFSGDKQKLLSHCNGQVERIMDLWNQNTEFREQYVKSNTYSTLRRLGTSDGRSLGPGEEPPILIRPPVDRSTNIISVPSSNIQTPAPVLEPEVRNLPEPSATKPVARTYQPAKLKSSTKPALVEAKSEELKKDEKDDKVKREEEEAARRAEELARKEEEQRKEKEAKEEELRKEKEAAELKERLRLEQKAKAREAEERKRRKAATARAKAEYRAQKEAELKEKKKAKKENKKSSSAETTNGSTEEASTLVLETNTLETSQESETPSVAASRKKSSKPVSLMKKQYNRVQTPVPLPLRNKGKRKMTTLMWACVVVLVVVVLFLAGNYISTSGLPFFSI